MPDQLSTPISVSANRILAPLTAARSAYRLWLDVGNVGTLADFLESLRGPEGLGAYEIAVNNGFVGTEAEWLESLTGAGGAGRVVRNSSFTASNGSSYSAGGVLTVSDPEPAEGAGYNVLIRSGIVTVGGVAYSSAGAVLERIYHAGAWVSYLYEDATHYQSALVSGVTIKTINNIGLLGSGNITIAGDITSGPVTASAGASVIADNAIEQVKINGLIAALNSKQATLSNYSTISALAGYPNSFPTTWSQVTTGVTNHIPFSVSPASLPTTEGTVSWNSDDHTLNIATDVSGVVLQVGQEQHVRVRNTTGATISNGAAVYLSGASGQRPTVALADADNDTHVASTIGLATADIAHNAFGYITVGGLVRGVNTAGMTEGGPIYLSGTAGGLTQTAPTSNVVRIGFCVVAGNNGTILVHVEKMSVKSVDVTDASTGGNGVSDADKLAKFSPAGGLTCTTLTAVSSLYVGLEAVALVSQIPDISTKQDTLVSGTNIKTVASQSILGSTNIPALLTDPTGITGAAALTNIVSLTQAQYDAIGSKSSTTLYVIT